MGGTFTSYNAHCDLWKVRSAQISEQYKFSVTKPKSNAAGYPCKRGIATNIIAIKILMEISLNPLA